MSALRLTAVVTSLTLLSAGMAPVFPVQGTSNCRVQDAAGPRALSGSVNDSDTAFVHVSDADAPDRLVHLVQNTHSANRLTFVWPEVDVTRPTHVRPGGCWRASRTVANAASATPSSSFILYGEQAQRRKPADYYPSPSQPAGAGPQRSGAPLESSLSGTIEGPGGARHVVELIFKSMASDGGLELVMESRGNTQVRVGLVRFFELARNDKFGANWDSTEAQIALTPGESRQLILTGAGTIFVATVPAVVLTADGQWLAGGPISVYLPAGG